MSMQERLLSLKGKHATLDTQLSNELQRPLPDTVLCSRIKREKLRIKDQILRLEEAAASYDGSNAVH